MTAARASKATKECGRYQLSLPFVAPASPPGDPPVVASPVRSERVSPPTSASRENHEPTTADEARARSEEPDATSDSLEEAARAAFSSLLASKTRLRWRINWTHNRQTMISFSRAHRPPLLRLHALFVEAPEFIVAHIADVLEGRRRRFGVEIDSFIRAQFAKPEWQAARRPQRQTPLKSVGKHVDLGPLFDRLNERYFGNRIRAQVGWMTPPRAGRRSMKLGSYSAPTASIRLHPALDTPLVPDYVVEAVLFHEMAHAASPAVTQEGRRDLHGKAFQAELARFPATKAADAWVRANLGTLMRAGRKRKKKA